MEYAGIEVRMYSQGFYGHIGAKSRNKIKFMGIPGQCNFDAQPDLSMIGMLNKLAGKFDLKLVSNKVAMPADIAGDGQFMHLYKQVRPFTMTSPERLYALYQAVLYTIEHKIEGDFVECGVWKGGSSMMILKTLQLLNVQDRQIWMYDTYEGMSEPTEEDRDFSGKMAENLLQSSEKADSNSVWCYSSLEEVQRNLATTGYPMENIRFIKGKVEDSIPTSMPERIALLRLDTDWYASTIHELVHLYPLLASKGILIIDDFGHWEGAKKAVLEYFGKQDRMPLIHRIDDTGRIIHKF